MKGIYPHVPENEYFAAKAASNSTLAHEEERGALLGVYAGSARAYCEHEVRQFGSLPDA